MWVLRARPLRLKINRTVINPLRPLVTWSREAGKYMRAAAATTTAAGWLAG